MVTVCKLFILQIDFFAVAVVRKCRNVVIRQSYIYLAAGRRRTDFGNGHTVRLGSKGCARPGAVFVGIAHADFSGFVICVTHIIGFTLLFLFNAKRAARVEAVNVIIACVVYNVFALYNALLDRFEFIRRVGAGAGVLVRQNKVHILINQCIAVRRTAGNHPLQPVARNHALSPSLCLIRLGFRELTISRAIGNFFIAVKNVADVGFFGAAGSQRHKQTAGKRGANQLFKLLHETTPF